MEIPYLLLQEAGIVGVASIYWLDDPRFESGQEQKVFLSSKILTPSLGPTHSLYAMVVEVPFPV